MPCLRDPVKQKKYFYVVIYRNNSQNQSEFDNFTINFELLLSKLHAENPFVLSSRVTLTAARLSGGKMVLKIMRESYLNQ